MFKILTKQDTRNIHPNLLSLRFSHVSPAIETSSLFIACPVMQPGKKARKSPEWQAIIYVLPLAISGESISGRQRSHSLPFHLPPPRFFVRRPRRHAPQSRGAKGSPGRRMMAQFVRRLRDRISFRQTLGSRSDGRVEGKIKGIRDTQPTRDRRAYTPRPRGP